MAVDDFDGDLSEQTNGEVESSEAVDIFVGGCCTCSIGLNKGTSAVE